MKLLTRTAHRYLRSQERGYFLSNLKKYFGFFLNTLSRIEYLISSNRKQYELSEMSNSIDRLFVFVSHGMVTKSEVELLDKMRTLGFYTILFSNEPYSSINKVDLFEKKVKYGRDFSIYRDVARSLAKNVNPEIEILFLNSSMYWFQDNFERLLLNLREVDRGIVVFPTESFNPVYHVQPYLLYARLTHEQKVSFSVSFEWVRNLVTKRAIVSAQELRIFDKLQQFGWQTKVLAPYQDLLATKAVWVEHNFPKRARHLLNPSLHFWDALGVFGVYGIKKSLFSHKFNVPQAPKSMEEAELEFQKNIPNEA